MPERQAARRAAAAAAAAGKGAAGTLISSRNVQRQGGRGGMVCKFTAIQPRQARTPPLGLGGPLEQRAHGAEAVRVHVRVLLREGLLLLIFRVFVGVVCVCVWVWTTSALRPGHQSPCNHSRRSTKIPPTNACTDLGPEALVGGLVGQRQPRHRPGGQLLSWCVVLQFSPVQPSASINRPIKPQSHTGPR